jgi:hypothetical protein
MIPVVFIHKGNSSYLYNTLYQLRQTNPLVKMYLLGTEESRVYEPLAETILIGSLSEEADLFAGVYKHYSTNSESFELMCIQRWLVLKAFMIKKDIRRCLYLDSDVLVYEDVQRLSDAHAHVGMTLCGISGHTNFVDRNVLIDFCAFIFDRYAGADALSALEKHYHAFVAKHGAGGVSDMTLLTMYAEKNPQKVENIYFSNGLPTFDPSLEVGEEYFEMENGQKKILFNDSKPYGFLKAEQKPVLFYTLHFQGAKAKSMMLKYIPVKSVLFWIQYINYTGMYYFQKIKSKIV